MGDRRARTTRSYSDAELVALTKKSIVGGESTDINSDEDPFADWTDEPGPIAAGSQGEALPTTSRTATLCDPLTTGLLAEVARRSQTIELDPTAVEAAKKNTQEIDRASLDKALKSARMPEGTTPPTTTKRRSR